MQNESRAFKVLVANRIEMMRDHIDIHQWYYIGTIYTIGTILVPRIIREIIVLEVLMWHMAKQFKSDFKDHLFCGNQKQSGPFKITKEGFYRMIQK